MKKIYLAVSTALVVSTLVITSPAGAQNPDSRTTTTERYDDDNDTNYGWIGLLGLIGLAGLMKRKDVRDVRDVRESNSPKYNS
jgi:LPXTG-motif cell wall-anchored protein